MTIKTAIKKAVENGWQPKEEHQCEIEGIPVRHTAGDMLDPEFWKALGKAEGWEMSTERDHWGDLKDTAWLNYWHKLIDHLAGGGSIEDYFKQL